MSNLVAGIVRYFKLFAAAGAYSIATFLLAALLMAIAPESYHMAILFGWILSIAVAGQVYRARYFNPHPA